MMRMLESVSVYFCEYVLEGLGGKGGEEKEGLSGDLHAAIPNSEALPKKGVGTDTSFGHCFSSYVTFGFVHS